jgi:transposase
MGAYVNHKLELKGNHSKDYFLKLSKNCKDKRLAWRYHAMYLSFAYNWEEIAEILGVDYRTILEWVELYNQYGIEGLDPNRPPGRPSTLTGDQLKQVKETVKLSPRSLGLKFSNWTIDRITNWIVDKFDVKLCAERIRQILHSIGFSYVKPIFSYIRANKTDKQRFLGEFMQCIKNNELFMFEDESTVDHHPTLHGMWVLKRTKPKVRTFGTHAKRHVFSAVNPLTGDKVSMVTKRLTAERFVKFGELMLEKMDRPFTLILDNSPCHKARLSMEFFEKHKDRIKTLWLPKYSPEMNPTEHVWKDMKFDVTHNHMFGTPNKLAWGIRGYFRQLKPEKVKTLCSVDYLFGRL